MEPKSVIQKLEALYHELMTKDLTPDEEAQAKVQLLEILSSIKAHAEIQGGEQARTILNQSNYLKELLLEWDPYGSAWFKEEKTLVDSVYNLVAAVKTLTIQKGVASEGMGVSDLRQKIDGIASALKSEIDNLKHEVVSIKKSVIALATAVKEKFETQSVSKQTVKPTSKSQVPESIPLVASSISIESSSQPKPVPIPGDKPEKTAPKPISLPKPVPIPLDSKNTSSPPEPFRSSTQAPITIPKPERIQVSGPTPQPIPLDEPEPIPLTAPDAEEPDLLDEPEGKSTTKPALIGALSSAKKRPSKKPDKEQLFNLFSGSPAGESGGEELELVEEPIELPKSASTQPAQPVSDPETLYQELISLEGKRYSIERSIRDLKTDRENGVISDQEYKGKMSQLLNKLQRISKRIGQIREKID